MCSPVRCHSCSKVTWSGCGQHVDMVMAQFAPEDRCECQTTAAPSIDFGSFFRR